MAIPIGAPEKFGQLLQTPAIAPTKARPEGAAAVPGASFGEQLANFVGEVNHAQQVADQKAVAIANGSSDDLHGTMVAIEEADIKLKLMSTARNKAIQAYQQIMRMGS